MTTMSIEPGEAITGDAESPVVAHVEHFEAGTDTVTVPLPAAGELATAATERLADDYPDVHLWAGDRTLAVTDHAAPVADEPTGYPVDLSALPAGVHRREVVTPTAGAVRTCVLRQYVVDALAEIPKAEPLTVAVDPGGLIVLETHATTVAAAPRAHPDGAWPDTADDVELPTEVDPA